MNDAAAPAPRTRRAVAVAAVGWLLLTGCTSTATTPRLRSAATATPAPAATFGPGADGIGDPYYPTSGNGGYDVGSYDLAVKYDPATDLLTGTATIKATATANLNRFDLDLKGLTVASVTIDGTAATDTRTGDKLVITPAKGLAAGTTFVTVVQYGGVPSPYQEPDLGQDGFLNTDDGAVAIGEPDVAAAWYPVNDHPRDKATYTVRITAPAGLTAMSNGVLQGKAPATPGWTTWTWVESAPMASYLATMVVGNFRVQQSTHAGKPVFLAVATSLDASIDATLARTPEIIDFLESDFGPYPFDAMGGIVINDKRIRFALENQTRPIYSAAFFHPGGDASWVVAHELTHQWYGDSVSVDQWKEIWLNEGFATYAEWLWSEHNGAETPQQAFDTAYARPGDALWKVPPAEPGKADLFSDSVYTRGGMTLQALRVTVGDGAFFKIIKAWAAEKAYRNATTVEFIAIAQRISGKRLGDLFNAWLYGKTRPALPHPG